MRKLLKQAPCDAFYLGRRARDVKDRPKVEVSNRCYEEQFLREPKQNERPCAKGSACEGLRLTNSDEGFILREYLLPSMYKVFLEKKTLPQFPQLCLLCRRAECSRLYVAMRSDDDSTGALISDIRNIAAPGEYSLDQCLLPCMSQKVGLFDPIVHHCRKLYSVARISGIRYVLQSGYDKPLQRPFFNPIAPLQVEREGALSQRHTTKHWFTERLKYEFRNTEWEGAFQSPWNVRGATDSDVGCREHRSQLCQRGEHVGVHLSERVVNPFLRRCLFLQIDLFLPRILEVETSGNLCYVRGEQFLFLEKVRQENSRSCYSRDLTPEQVYWKEPYPPFIEQEPPAEVPDPKLEHLEH